MPALRKTANTQEFVPLISSGVAEQTLMHCYLRHPRPGPGENIYPYIERYKPCQNRNFDFVSHFRIFHDVVNRKMYLNLSILFT